MKINFTEEEVEILLHSTRYIAPLLGTSSEVAKRQEKESLKGLSLDDMLDRVVELHVRLQAALHKARLKKVSRQRHKELSQKR